MMDRMAPQERPDRLAQLEPRGLQARLEPQERERPERQDQRGQLAAPERPDLLVPLGQLDPVQQELLGALARLVQQELPGQLAMKGLLAVTVRTGLPARLELQDLLVPLG